MNLRCPDLIHTVCQDRVQREQGLRMHGKHSVEWSLKDLSTCMEKLCSIDSWPCKFCFFIDGLDEYAGSATEQSSMVKHLQRLTEGGNVKICVSSRPWNVFRSAYSGHGKPALILQDHTKTDIDIYIEGQLEADARFRCLVTVQAEMGEFAREIRRVHWTLCQLCQLLMLLSSYRRRANGVFLWVFLVVRSLLDGLTEDDDLRMLQQRLNALPPTLEEYFELMLGCIDPTYKKYTAQALLLACNATEPLPDQAYYYLNTEMSEPDYAVKMALKPASPEEIDIRRESVRSWINKWCRDLLEVNRQSWASNWVDTTRQYRVDFLHRTIGDFLAAEEMQKRFQRDAGDCFDPQLSLCRSYLAQAKTLTRTRSGSRNKFFEDFALLAGFVLFHAKACEVANNTTPVEILNDLDQVGDIYWDTPTEHWTAVCPGIDGDSVPQELAFLAYAIEFDLQIYVRTAIEALQVYSEGQALLEIACRPSLQHVALPQARKPSQRMMALLAGLVVIERDATPTDLTVKVERLRLGG